MSKDINVLAFAKGEERYLFLYNDETRAETLRTLGRFASNPELSFSWYDAAVLSQRVRAELANKNVAVPESNSRLSEAFDVLFDEDPSA